MITDRTVITEALASVTRSQDLFICFTGEEAQRVCPSPDWAVHVIGRNVPTAIAKLKAELAEARTQKADGLLLFVRSTGLRMADLEEIDAALPHPERFARGIDFSKPWGGEAEIWLFGC